MLEKNLIHYVSRREMTQSLGLHFVLCMSLETFLYTTKSISTKRIYLYYRKEINFIQFEKIDL